jgi:hypothetical protein
MCAVVFSVTQGHGVASGLEHSFVSKGRSGRLKTRVCCCIQCDRDMVWLRLEHSFFPRGYNWEV